LASYIGLPTASNNKDICHCCGYEVHTSKISMWGDHKDLSHLGMGFPLFF
jgi:hypothetical protein